MQVVVYTKPDLETEEPNGSLKPLYNFYHVAWRTKWEMAIIEASASVRSEPDWIEALEDKATVQQWVDRLKTCPDMAQAHLDYFVAELRYYAKLQRASLDIGTKHSTVDMVWTMDIDDDDPLVQDFIHHVVDALEGVRSDDQDWTTICDMEPTKERSILVQTQYPRLGSKCKVLRLISPSLYTLLFDKSPHLEYPITSPLEAVSLASFGQIPGSHAAWKQAVCELNQRMAGDSSYIPINEEYLDKLDLECRHWLPADIHINDDGSVGFKSYINSLHPGKYPEAYKSIAKIIARCLPALEQVLTDWEHRSGLRVPYDIGESAKETVSHPYDIPSFDDDDDDDDYAASDAAKEVWKNSAIYTTPVSNAFIEPDRPLKPSSLRNKDLQVIVKMENLYRRPGEPYFDDEEWQGDGTASEQIVATIVYYYDIENVEGIQMEFREGVSTVILKSRREWLAYRYLFNARSAHGESYFYDQPAGQVRIQQGQAVCYPNVYQHCMTNVRFKDRSKPSHVKMLVLHFVDPSVRILSTSVVPPQQKKWWIEGVRQTILMRSLPWFAQNMIIDNVDMPMPFSTAADNRKRLDDKTLTDNDYDHDDVIDFFISRFDLIVLEGGLFG